MSYLSTHALRPALPARLARPALLLGTAVLVILGGLDVTDVPADPPDDTTQSLPAHVEDWHGNVRRSNWPG